MVSGPERGHEQHRHLRALRLLERLEPRGDGVAVGRGERAGEVDHASRQLRHRDGIRRVRGEGREREEEGRGRPREEAAGDAVHFAGRAGAGAAGLGEKSTFGGSAMAFSFSTVKFAFSL